MLQEIVTTSNTLPWQNYKGPVHISMNLFSDLFLTSKLTYTYRDNIKYKLEKDTVEENNFSRTSLIQNYKVI